MTWTRVFGVAAMLCMVPTEVLYAQDDDFTSDLFFGGLTTTDVLPKNRLQWETFAYYSRAREDGLTANDWSLNSSLLRFGLNGSSELRLQGSLLHTDVEDYHETGLANIAVGLKTRLFEGRGWIPAIAVLGNLYIPGGKDSAFLPDELSYGLSLIFCNQICPWLSLGYQYELNWYNNESPSHFFGAFLDFFLSDKMCLTVEESNVYDKSYDDNRLQPAMAASLAYRVHRRAEMVFETAWSIDDKIHGFSLTLGVAWQLTK